MCAEHIKNGGDIGEEIVGVCAMGYVGISSGNKTGKLRVVYISNCRYDPNSRRHSSVARVHIICVKCLDRNSDFIKLSKSCKGENLCLDRIPQFEL